MKSKFIQFLVTFFKTKIQDFKESKKEIEKLELQFLEDINTAKKTNKELVDTAYYKYDQSCFGAKSIYYEMLAKAQLIYGQKEKNAYQTYLSVKKSALEDYEKAESKAKSDFELVEKPADQILTDEIAKANQWFNLDIYPIKKRYDKLRLILLFKKTR